MIEETSGNLLNANAQALVNTVNTVGVMGRGIALQFKNAFPANYRAYRQACEEGRLQPGGIVVYDAGPFSSPRYILNVATKKHWKGSSRLEWVKAGAEAIARTVRELRIESVAIPPLGCGSEGLSWRTVAPLIREAFRTIGGVKVYVYPPHGAPPAGEMKIVSDRPRMTSGRAAVLALMARYLRPGFQYRLSLLEIQKLAYLLQAAGQDLKLRFSPTYYGPYADNLRHVLNRLEGHYITGVGDDSTRPDVPVALMPGATEEAEAYLERDSAAQRQLSRVAALIDGFESPYGMELLATVHWVATRSADVSTEERAYEGIAAWGAAKAKRMRREHVYAAWERLVQEGWLGNRSRSLEAAPPEQSLSPSPDR